LESAKLTKSKNRRRLFLGKKHSSPNLCGKQRFLPEDLSALLKQSSFQGDFMKSIMLPAVILLISSLVIVNQNSAQSLDKQKPVEKNQNVKVAANESVTPNIAAPNIVKSLNSLTGDLNLQAGANITVTPNANSLIIAAPNVLTSVVTDASLTGNGTSGNPLRIAADSAFPFSESVAFSIAPNVSTGGVELLTVPAGKRLIIEHASGQCIAPPGQFISQFEISIYSPTLPKRSELFIAPAVSGSDPVLGNIYVASSPVKFYVDAGYTVQVRAWRGTVVSGEVGCSFNYSASLVNQP
jgi:hypothetical protein